MSDIDNEVEVLAEKIFISMQAAGMGEAGSAHGAFQCAQQFIKCREQWRKEREKRKTKHAG